MFCTELRKASSQISLKCTCKGKQSVFLLLISKSLVAITAIFLHHYFAEHYIYYIFTCKCKHEYVYTTQIRYTVFYFLAL